MNTQENQEQVTDSDRRLWDNIPGLIWSNPNASNDAHIAAALLKRGFLEILAIAAHFGLDRVKNVWAILKAEADNRLRQSSPFGGILTTQERSTIFKKYEALRA